MRAKSGLIKVNGKRPADPNNNIPGTGVGFMPQVIRIFNLNLIFIFEDFSKILFFLLIKSKFSVTLYEWVRNWHSIKSLH